MTAKEYLKQAYRLDHRIDSDIEELGRLREMSTNISAPTMGDKVQTNRSKNEIRNVIDTVSNTDERMVLRYRYIHNYTWEQIGDELGADSRTVRRWHGKALTHVELPENPIKI